MLGEKFAGEGACLDRPDSHPHRLRVAGGSEGCVLQPVSCLLSPASFGHGRTNLPSRARPGWRRLRDGLVLRGDSVPHWGERRKRGEAVDAGHALRGRLLAHYPANPSLLHGVVACVQRSHSHSREAAPCGPLLWVWSPDTHIHSFIPPVLGFPKAWHPSGKGGLSWDAPKLTLDTRIRNSTGTLKKTIWSPDQHYPLRLKATAEQRFIILTAV